MTVGLGSGIFAYQLNLGLNAWILGLLWMRGTWKKYPLFSAYTLARILKDLVLFPLLVGVSLDAYSRGWWLADPILLALEVLAVFEVLGRPKFGVVPAVPVFVAQWFLVVPKKNAAANLECYTLIAVACLSLIAIIRKPNDLLAWGFFVSAFGSGICFNLPFLWNAVDSRFIPSYAFLVAQICWIVWARRLEPVTSSE